MLSEEEKRMRHNATQKRYYDRNKEKVLRYQSEYAKANRATKLARGRANSKRYYAINRERILKWHADRRKERCIKIEKHAVTKTINPMLNALNIIVRSKL